MKRVNVWMRLSPLILALLLIACEKAPSNVTPPVVEYSAGFQAHAATELERSGPPCPRDVVITGCSAVHRLVIDFKDMRDKTRALTR